ncbi:MAG: hypothetical protein WED87_07850, partial [Dehalococcoidia bacterium]
EAYDAAGAPVAAAGAVAGEALTGTMPDGTMRFPPGVGTGEKGDANSPEKVRARRMRAERKIKELQESGEPVPEDIAQTLFDLGSDLAPNGTIWATLATTAPAAGAATAVAAGPSGGTNADGSMRFPPGVGTGDKGDPNSPEKVRARRMRAERKFKELTDSGEAVPDDVAQVLYETGSDLAPGGSIWEKELGGGAAAAPAPAAPAAAAGAASDDGDWTPPAGVVVGAKGEPNSLDKLRARRMRAERKAKEAVAKGEAIPDDVMATLTELGGAIPESGQ